MRQRVRESAATADEAAGKQLRTVAELFDRQTEIGKQRLQAEKKREEAERLRRQQLEEAARQIRIQSLRKKGEAAWIEVENEIGKTNREGYKQAIALLADLRSLAVEDGKESVFRDRLEATAGKHIRKKTFIIELNALKRTF